MFADDNLMLLQGDKIELILQMLVKIGQYRFVAGLILNLVKCEIMVLNCHAPDIQRIVQQTGMKRVIVMKHLGLKILISGELAYDDNIAPVQAATDKIADSLSNTTSTSLGRSLYAKFLLSSRYLHKIQNFSFTDNQLLGMRSTILRLTGQGKELGQTPPPPILMLLIIE